MPIAAPADKRFRRAHISPTRRRWAVRMSWPSVVRVGSMIAVVLYGGYRAASLALSAEALTVTRIAISGNERLSRGEIVSLLDGLSGESMVTINLERWRQKLMTSPWVEDAALRRVLPGTVTVVISERQPLGIARITDHLYLIDARGSIIDEFGPNYAEFDLPLIDGLAAPPGSDGLLDPARAGLVARLLASLHARPDLAKRISQVDVNDVRNAVVILKSDTALVHIGEAHFVERLQSYLDLAPALRERVPHIDYVDLRFDERVYVRPQAAGPRPQNVGKGR